MLHANTMKPVFKGHPDERTPSDQEIFSLYGPRNIKVPLPYRDAFIYELIFMFSLKTGFTNLPSLHPMLLCRCTAE